MADRSIVIAAAHRRYDHLEQRLRLLLSDREVVRVRAPQDLTIDTLRQVDPVFVFFPHWSWLVPKDVHGQFECVIFHMTDVPYGRGGSPLQNLIVRGHKETVMSALKCVSDLDAGPVYMKRPLSLVGTAEEILTRAAAVIEGMIVEIVEGRPAPVPQQGEVIEFRRRRPEDGNLAPLADLGQIADYIRMLDAEGYPRAFLDTPHLHLEFSDAQLGDEFVEARVRIRNKP